MKKTLTIKDYFLFGLIILLVVLLLLSMNQVDRQWLKLTRMENTIAEQSKDVSAIRALVSKLQQKISNISLQPQQVQTASNTQTSPNPNANSQNEIDQIPEAFKHEYEATQKEDYAQGGWFVSS